MSYHSDHKPRLQEGDERHTVAEHDMHEAEEYIEHVGAHASRVETKQFVMGRELLEKEFKVPCFVCFMQNLDTFQAGGKLPKNSEITPEMRTLASGACITRLAYLLRLAGHLDLLPNVPGDHERHHEDHHFACEYSHEEAASAAKLALLTEAMDWYGLSADAMAKGEPDPSTGEDVRNHLILCWRHHQKHGESAHHIPWAVLMAMCVVRDGEVAVEPLEGYHGEKKEASA